MQSATPGSNPYPGARPFRAGEALYGRDYEIAEVTDLLIAERTVLLCGPAASGKSSLIQAGIVPAIQREGFAALPVIRLGRQTAANSGSCSAADNRYVLSALLSLEEGHPANERLSREELRNLELPGYLALRRTWESGGKPALLVFDQFEEVLSLDPTDSKAKELFLRQLAVTLRDPQRWVMLAIRDEYVPALEPLLEAARARPHSHFRLDHLTPAAARQAVETPAREAGIPFTASAAQQLIESLRRTAILRADGSLAEGLAPLVEPLHLQLACHHLWSHLPPGIHEIRESDLPAAGSFDRFVERYILDRVRGIARETRVSERAVRDWVLRHQIA